MPHYTLFCHGSINFVVEQYSGYVAPGDMEKATVPERTSVVFYIKPGTIFDGHCGIELVNTLDRMALTDDFDSDKLSSTIGGQINYREKKSSPSADMPVWDTAPVDFEYPRLCSNGRNDEYLYDYKLNGPRQGEDLQGLTMGLKRVGGAMVHEIKRAEPYKTTLSAVLSLAQDDAGEAPAFVHCIFCRGEKLSGDALDYAREGGFVAAKYRRAHLFNH